MNKIIFKSYDIRGIYPSELNEESAYKIGRAFAIKTKAPKIALIRDGRLSSNSLFKSLSKGIISYGSEVHNFGCLPTELLYFSVGYYPEIKAGIMITASHNPKEYNGFKMIEKKGKNINVIRGKDLIETVEKENSFQEKKQGQIKKREVRKDFLNYILKFVNLNKIKKLKIVIDASNGVAGKIISPLKEKLPLKIIPLNFQTNGNFPNHSPNPLATGALNQISQRIKKEKADFGLIFDGDADRLFLLDENGKFIPADIVLLLLAKYLLKENPGSAVSYNVICSRAVPQFIEKWGGKAIKTKVGFVNVREGIIKNKGIIGGEMSGHYCFKDFFYLDSGIMAFFTLLKLISSDNKKVSEMVKEFLIYAKTSEINFKISNKESILEKIKKKYNDGKQDFLDGITTEYKDWWFNVRISQTEPLLRLTIEAKNEKLLQKKKEEISSFIKRLIPNT